jgi:hypothetical protein
MADAGEVARVCGVYGCEKPVINGFLSCTCHWNKSCVDRFIKDIVEFEGHLEKTDSTQRAVFKRRFKESKDEKETEVLSVLYSFYFKGRGRKTKAARVTAEE